MSLGARLREVRLRQAVSTETLAMRVGLSPDYIAEVESGLTVPSHETLESWARALQVPFSRLFFTRPEAAWTPWLSPRVTLEPTARQWRRSVLAILLDWLRQAAIVRWGGEEEPEEKSGS
jgi:transcriptional regulator with XRE-family HTH domain